MIRTTTDGSWRSAPLLSLEWRLGRVRDYLRRLPLSRVRAIVFGSVGRRAFSIGSDTDLLVISDELPAEIRARIDLLGDLRDGLGEIDPVGWTELEWVRRLADGDPFAACVAREGIAVATDGDPRR
jgi:predicted nucleotidyltransferase